MRATTIFALSLVLALALTLQILARARACCTRRCSCGAPRILSRAPCSCASLTPLAPCRSRRASTSQACALYNNWWPLLTGVVYVLVPMPFLFLRGDTSDSYALMGGESDSWVDVAKFLTGAQ
jgi:hypothetical protein